MRSIALLVLTTLAVPAAAQSVAIAPRGSVLFSGAAVPSAGETSDPGYKPYSLRTALLGSAAGAGLGALAANLLNAGAGGCEDAVCDDSRVSTGRLLAYMGSGAILGFIIGGRLGPKPE